uniref:Uncharacterized protein n=1 Tax=Physcomitrium patens TaxID=3218 RepID=A0A2K1K044_PHYPA|nr:hypothetical protein PHYPA_014266 [Physcomitrium patens]
METVLEKCYFTAAQVYENETQRRIARSLHSFRPERFAQETVLSDQRQYSGHLGSEWSPHFPMKDSNLEGVPSSKLILRHA